MMCDNALDYLYSLGEKPRVSKVVPTEDTAGILPNDSILAQTFVKCEYCSQGHLPGVICTSNPSGCPYRKE